MIILCEILAKNKATGAEQVFRYSSGKQMPIVDGKLWRARLKNTLTLGMGIFSDEFQSAGAERTVGQIEIIIADGELDEFVNYDFLYQNIKIWTGQQDQEFNDFKLVFHGLIESNLYDERTMRLKLGDLSNSLEEDLKIPNYTGTGTYGGNADLKGHNMPMAWGECFNIEPVLIDTVNLIYQCHFRQIESIDGVYDKGAAITYDGDTSDLTSWTAIAGKFKTDLSRGLFKLGAKPVGLITADIKGDSVGGYVNSADQIIKRIFNLSQKSALLNIDDISFSALHAANSSRLGFFSKNLQKTSDIFSHIMRSLGGFWHVDWKGNLKLDIFDFKNSSGDITERHLIAIEKSEDSAPVWKLSNHYAPNWRQQSLSEIAQGSTGAKWFRQSGIPAASLGEVGDFYIDTETNKYYEKTGENTWAEAGDLKGDAGDKGVAGNTGSKGDKGEAGKNAQGSNLLKMSEWIIGTGGSQVSEEYAWTAIGDNSESSIIEGDGPFGDKDPLWKAKELSTGSDDSSGGFLKKFKLKSDKESLRFAIYAKQTATSGSVYLGCDSSGRTLNLDDSVKDNPYFWMGDLPELNKWFLVIGILHRSETTQALNSKKGGIYSLATGEKLQEGNDFKIKVGATTQLFRAFQYYSNKNEIAYFTRPRVDILDGNEPTIAELVNNVEKDKKGVFLNKGTDDLANWSRKHNYYEPLHTTTIVDDNGVKAIRSSGVDGREIFSREYIKIDPTKNYRVRCKIKATGVNKRNYSLIVAYDINKTYLSNSNYNAGWRATGDYFYYSYSNPTPNNWTEYQQLFGPAFEAKLPAGTEYIKLGWLTNYKGYGTGDTLIKDLELIEVDPRSFLALRKNGSILSQKILGANQSAGARSATNIYPASSTSNSITIAPFSAQFDFGKIYYNGGTITGLSPSTKYHIYCDDDKMIGGGITWKATKNIQEACNRSGRLKLLTFATRPLGGTTPVPVPGDDFDRECVAINQYIELGFAENASKGGDILILDEGGSGYFKGQIEQVSFSKTPCVELVTTTGIKLICSETTPVTLRDGIKTEFAPFMAGIDIAVLDNGNFRWEEVISVTNVGIKPVAHISVGGRSYAAGSDKNRLIFTHNMQKP